MSTSSLAQHNKALLREIFEAVGRGDGRLFASHLANDARMTITGEGSWSQVVEGKERILEFFRYVRSRIAEHSFRTQAFHFLADDDWVVVEARGDMVTLSGEPYRNHYCLMYRLEDDLIIEIKEYQDSLMGERSLGPCPPHLRSQGAFTARVSPPAPTPDLQSQHS
ncbi:hypothetical protein HNQ60_005145 [Povalibacter uvarum]|uniref:SnoaL-like domain-containing protein n=1 Tax=Povalibacter uvarum TaxID=732238 RepID=A0A841HTV0_9GAMM|nr:nuclear transport factor 2 family protein [Povalibacter uvarum]MBB6096223.1 hypothetical protein [Povalibacter uvarum]